jgi:hypothetical protein
MNNIHILHSPKRSNSVSGTAKIRPGCRCSMNVPESSLAMSGKDVADLDHYLQSGVVGAYRLGINSAEIEPVDLNLQPVQGFVWDADLLTPVMSQWLQPDQERPRTSLHNRLTLLDANLEAPQVVVADEHPVLTISPRFELEWSTEAFASQLGVVQLVESSRTLRFADGETLTLLDTEAAGAGPVLYLNDATGALAVKPVCPFQPQGGKQRIDYAGKVAQIIPAEVQGQPVESVSVLEKYTVYFMQNAAPDDTDRHIWVPVHLPVVWGWSIRVQQRFDGVWDIFRKKLIMPTPTTEAPALPSWQTNSLLCRSQPMFELFGQGQ